METHSTATPSQGALLGMVREFCARNRARTYLIAAACLMLMTGCATTSTVVERVWHEGSRAASAPGKTLVVVSTTDPKVSSRIENEWVRMLSGRGIDAQAMHVLRPGRQPNRQGIVELVKATSFDTVLVSRKIGSKRVERDVSAYQVVAVETTLYDTKTELPYWTVRSDTFLANPLPDGAANPSDELIRGFVRTILAEMSKSKVLEPGR